MNNRQFEKSEANICYEANIRFNMYFFCIKSGICMWIFVNILKRMMWINGVCEYAKHVNKIHICLICFEANKKKLQTRRTLFSSQIFSKTASTVCNNIFTGHLYRYASIFIFSLSLFGTSDLKFFSCSRRDERCSNVGLFYCFNTPCTTPFIALCSVYLVPALERQIIEMMLTVSLINFLSSPVL